MQSRVNAPDRQKGKALFQDRCADCLMSMNIGGNGYYVFGVQNKPAPPYLPPDGLGRSTVQAPLKEDYAFKAPSFRNVALTAPYFHSGSAWTLGEAVKVMAKSQLEPDLDVEEIDAIVVFLQSLTGDQPELSYPILLASTTQTPRPAK